MCRYEFYCGIFYKLVFVLGLLLPFLYSILWLRFHLLMLFVFLGDFYIFCCWTYIAVCIEFLSSSLSLFVICRRAFLSGLLVFLFLFPVLLVFFLLVLGIVRLGVRKIFFFHGSYFIFRGFCTDGFHCVVDRVEFVWYEQREFGFFLNNCSKFLQNQKCFLLKLYQKVIFIY